MHDASTAASVALDAEVPSSLADETRRRLVVGGEARVVDG
jgi:hypothetical protein